MVQTMVKNVKSLRRDASIRKDEDDRLIMEEHTDNVEKFYEKT